MGILYFCTFVCNFIPVVFWLGLADGGVCDDADPNHDDAFLFDTINFPGYSLGGLMICIIADIVACGAVCCCWGDNRHYGDERDTAKVDRQREKEFYKQQEAEMQAQQQQQQQQQQQPPPQQYDNTNYNQPNNDYNNNNQYPPQQYGGQPNQYNNQPNQYGQQPNQYGQQPNMTYSNH